MPGLFWRGSRSAPWRLGTQYARRLERIGEKNDTITITNKDLPKLVQLPCAAEAIEGAWRNVPIWGSADLTVLPTQTTSGYRVPSPLGFTTSATAAYDFLRAERSGLAPIIEDWRD